MTKFKRHKGLRPKWGPVLVAFYVSDLSKPKEVTLLLSIKLPPQAFLPWKKVTDLIHKCQEINCSYLFHMALRTPRYIWYE